MAFFNLEAAGRLASKKNPDASCECRGNATRTPANSTGTILGVPGILGLGEEDPSDDWVAGGPVIIVVGGLLFPGTIGPEPDPPPGPEKPPGDDPGDAADIPPGVSGTWPWGGDDGGHGGDDDGSKPPDGGGVDTGEDTGGMDPVTACEQCAAITGGDYEGACYAVCHSENPDDPLDPDSDGPDDSPIDTGDTFFW